MPELVRMYIRHVLIGFGLGLTFTGLLLWLNIGKLRHLVRATDEGPIAGVMLVVFNTIVFAGVQFGFAVMGMADHDQPDNGLRAHAGDMAEVAVEGGGNRSDRAGVNFPRA